MYCALNPNYIEVFIQIIEKALSSFFSLYIFFFLLFLNFFFDLCLFFLGFVERRIFYKGRRNQIEMKFIMKKVMDWKQEIAKRLGVIHLIWENEKLDIGIWCILLFFFFLLVISYIHMVTIYRCCWPIPSCSLMIFKLK